MPQHHPDTVSCTSLKGLSQPQLISQLARSVTERSDGCFTCFPRDSLSSSASLVRCASTLRPHPILHDMPDAVGHEKSGISRCSLNCSNEIGDLCVYNSDQFRLAENAFGDMTGGKVGAGGRYHDGSLSFSVRVSRECLAPNSSHPDASCVMCEADRHRVGHRRASAVDNVAASAQTVSIPIANPSEHRCLQDGAETVRSSQDVRPNSCRRDSSSDQVNGVPPAESPKAPAEIPLGTGAVLQNVSNTHVPHGSPRNGSSLPLYLRPAPMCTPDRFNAIGLSTHSDRIFPPSGEAPFCSETNRYPSDNYSVVDVEQVSPPSVLVIHGHRYARLPNDVDEGAYSGQLDSVEPVSESGGALEATLRGSGGGPFLKDNFRKSPSRIVSPVSRDALPRMASSSYLVQNMRRRCKADQCSPHLPAVPKAGGRIHGANTVAPGKDLCSHSSSFSTEVAPEMISSSQVEFPLPLSTKMRARVPHNGGYKTSQCHPPIAGLLGRNVANPEAVDGDSCSMPDSQVRMVTPNSPSHTDEAELVRKTLRGGIRAKVLGNANLIIGDDGEVVDVPTASVMEAQLQSFYSKVLNERKRRGHPTRLGERANGSGHFCSPRGRLHRSGSMGCASSLESEEGGRNATPRSATEYISTDPKQASKSRNVPGASATKQNTDFVQDNCQPTSAPSKVAAGRARATDGGRTQPLTVRFALSPFASTTALKRRLPSKSSSTEEMRSRSPSQGVYASLAKNTCSSQAAVSPSQRLDVMLSISVVSDDTCTVLCGSPDQPSMRDLNVRNEDQISNSKRLGIQYVPRASASRMETPDAAGALESPLPPPLPPLHFPCNVLAGDPSIPILEWRDSEDTVLVTRSLSPTTTSHGNRLRREMVPVPCSTIAHRSTSCEDAVRMSSPSAYPKVDTERKEGVVEQSEGPCRDILTASSSDTERVVEASLPRDGTAHLPRLPGPTMPALVPEGDQPCQDTDTAGLLPCSPCNGSSTPTTGKPYAKTGTMRENRRMRYGTSKRRRISVRICSISPSVNESNERGSECRNQQCIPTSATGATSQQSSERSVSEQNGCGCISGSSASLRHTRVQRPPSDPFPNFSPNPRSCGGRRKRVNQPLRRNANNMCWISIGESPAGDGSIMVRLPRTRGRTPSSSTAQRTTAVVKRVPHTGPAGSTSSPRGIVREGACGTGTHRPENPFLRDISTGELPGMPRTTVRVADGPSSCEKTDEVSLKEVMNDTFVAPIPAKDLTESPTIPSNTAEPATSSSRDID